MNRRIPFGLVSILVIGCMTPFSTTQKGSCLLLKPQVTGGYLTQTVVSPYTSASIDHLTIRLIQGGSEVASRTIPQVQLSNTIAFSNLRANTSYRIKSYAYLADNTLISHDDASSWLDITTGIDDRPTLVSLPVHLIDRSFNGQGTGSLQISNGGYLPQDPENLQYTKSWTITTIAGNGTAGYAGDGGAATLASINTPCGVAVDGAGNVYVAENSSNRIRKISPSGVISTVAGNGTLGSSGDDGPATLAAIYTPNGIVVDAVGNIYFSEGTKCRIRKVATNGTITTVAGNGTEGFSGDGGPATLASLTRAYGVTVDSAGLLYICDTFAHRIRKVDANGIITTVVGNGSAVYAGDGGPATLASINAPFGAAVDRNGNIYIADQSNRRIRRVTTGGIITTIAGNGTRAYKGDGGPAIGACLDGPRAIALDELGNVYFVDEYVHRVRKITTDGWILTVAGNGTGAYLGDGGMAPLASLNKPIGIAVDKTGSLYIGDTLNHAVRKVN